MRVRVWAEWVLGAGFVVAAGLLGAACGGTSDGSGTGEGRALLIVDRDAREAGVEVLLPSGPASSVNGALALDGLPAVLDAPIELTVLRPGEAPATIDLRGDEVLHLRGAVARADVMSLGEAIDPDRVVLHAEETTVVAIARELRGDVERAPDGAWIVIAPEALLQVASPEVRMRLGLDVAGVREAFPVERVEVRDGGPSLEEIVEAVDPQVPEAEVLDDVAPAPEVIEPAPAPAPVEIPEVPASGAGQMSHPSDAALRAMVATQPIAVGVSAARLGARPEGVIGEGVVCADPVAGTWVGLIHDARYTDWYEFTLEIRHAPGAAGEAGQLVGEIRSRSWWGGPNVAQAPAECSPWGGTLFHWTVGMRAEGAFTGGKLRFGGTDWHVATTPCGSAPPHPDGYNLDVFSGWVTADGAYFDATNTDGGRMREFPTPFRRVSCAR